MWSPVTPCLLFRETSCENYVPPSRATHIGTPDGRTLGFFSR